MAREDKGLEFTLCIMPDGLTYIGHVPQGRELSQLKDVTVHPTEAFIAASLNYPSTIEGGSPMAMMYDSHVRDVIGGNVVFPLLTITPRQAIAVKTLGQPKPAFVEHRDIGLKLEELTAKYSG